MKLLFRWFINTLALLAVTQLIDGFVIETFYNALIAALALGLLNALLRPLLLILTLPLNLMTLGLFTFVVNGFIVWFMGTFIKGVEITGFWPALFAAIVLWAVSVVTNHLLKHSN